MSVNRIKERRISKPKRICVIEAVNDRVQRRERIHRIPLSPVTDEEEGKLIIRALEWLVILAIAPWILFYVLNFFYPGIFLIQISPN